MNNPGGSNQYSEGKEDKVYNININQTSSPKPKGGNRAEYFISRLKRDAAENTQAAELLQRVEDGAIKPYR